jgi:Tfp pilus assembly protein PilF
LEQNPSDFDKLCELAELYWQVESEAEALLTVSEILDQDPNCERALQLQAVILREQKSRQQSGTSSSGK